jgi:outer membrane protein OmpA-like peptidoglycan-associated protein
VDVVTQKGGIVTWASTREYNQQMPAVIIGNVEWMNKNREFVVGLLKAVDRGSFTIRTEANGLSLLGNAQAEIFGQAGGPEASPQFWSKYYVGEEMRDTQGNKVRLGGSRAATLAEIRDFFGLGDGAYNVYKGVYDVFGGYARTFYPNDVPEIPDFNKVVDTSFVEDALKGVTMSARRTQFAAGASITRAVSTRSYSIVFDTGTATIRPESLAVLRELANQSGMTGLRINIYGHTDNTGNDAVNFALSKARAQAIADWLFKIAPATFPRERMEVKGYGSSMPVGDNATEAGRQANRRVEITLGE